MSDDDRTLNYESPQGSGVPWWGHVWKYLVWPLIVMNIYGGCILGILFFILGIISFFHPIEGFY